MKPNYKSELVYSSDLAKGQAVEVTFKVAASDVKRLEEATSILPRAIKRAQQKANDANKRQLPAFLLEEWKKHDYTQKLNGREVSVMSDEVCMHVSS